MDNNPNNGRLFNVEDMRYKMMAQGNVPQRMPIGGNLINQQFPMGYNVVPTGNFNPQMPPGSMSPGFQIGQLMSQRMAMGGRVIPHKAMNLIPGMDPQLSRINMHARPLTLGDIGRPLGKPNMPIVRMPDPRANMPMRQINMGNISQMNIPNLNQIRRQNIPVSDINEFNMMARRPAPAISIRVPTQANVELITQMKNEDASPKSATTASIVAYNNDVTEMAKDSTTAEPEEQEVIRGFIYINKKDKIPANDRCIHVDYRITGKGYDKVLNFITLLGKVVKGRRRKVKSEEGSEIPSSILEGFKNNHLNIEDGNMLLLNLEVMPEMDQLVDVILGRLADNDVRLLKACDALKSRISSSIYADGSTHEHFVLSADINEDTEERDYVVKYQFGTFKDCKSNSVPLFTNIYCGNSDPSFLLTTRGLQVNKKICRSSLNYYQLSKKFDMSACDLKFGIAISKLISEEQNKLFKLTFSCYSHTLPNLLSLISLDK